MSRPRLNRSLYAFPFATLALIVTLILSTTLPAATVITGDVTPPLPWNSSTSPKIGNIGSGTLIVDDGSELLSGTTNVGDASGSTGSATISGSGSRWTSSSVLYVANYGSGTLRVEAGGQVEAFFGRVGYQSGAIGTATISGVQSGWSVLLDLWVGQYGSGTLRIEEGGRASSGRESWIGQQTGSTGSAIIMGPGSEWQTTNQLHVGYAGSGSLRVEAGGQVSNGREGWIGQQTGSSGSVTITGAGSKWTSRYPLYVGDFGHGTLIVANGGQVSATSSLMGGRSGSTGTATVTGASSMWTNAGSLTIGDSGIGTLRVDTGAQVSNTTGTLGYSLGSAGTATVTGVGSKWANNSGLQVGRNGTGSLTITDGGLVSAKGTLTIDSNGGADSFVNLSTGGMLALWGDADDSLAQFLGLVSGTDAIRYWDDAGAAWAPITAAALGVDYTLEYFTTGDLSGYTLLTVGTLPTTTPGDYNADGLVDEADFLKWRRDFGSLVAPGTESDGNGNGTIDAADYTIWRHNFGSGTLASAESVPEPATLTLVGLAFAGLLGQRTRKKL